MRMLVGFNVLFFFQRQCAPWVALNTIILGVDLGCNFNLLSPERSFETKGVQTI